ncbi:MAG TPA: Tm-1-like ATP-binding domain-containing protein, partial [Armatimonadota bacterium]|nr:Tm-1-like ATP-binding domain-containing protein [Armatimonadota bacterium]
MATIGIIGTLDTKGAEFAYLRERLHALGVETVVVDCGT